ncbi:MAG: anti-sigma factor family protein [Armatimonadota bacterium]
MECPLSPELWKSYLETGESLVAQHLEHCASCRVEAREFVRLRKALATLDEVVPPAQVAASYSTLAAATDGRTFDCAETLPLLDTWRAGELDGAPAFLVEDHLLHCASCATASAQDAEISLLLGALPALEPPAAIAERLAQARLPWWQRLLPAPAPVSVWGRAGMAFAAAAASLLLAVQAFQQPVGSIHVAKPTYTTVAARQVESIPLPIGTPVQPIAAAPVQAPAGVPAPATVSGNPDSPATNPPGEHRPDPVLMASYPQPLHNPVPALMAPDLPDSGDSVASLTKKDPEEGYSYEARDAVLTVARDAELTSIEESLSTPPVEVKGKFAELPARSTAKSSGMTPASNTADHGTSFAEQLRRDLSEEYHRRNKPALPQPIVSHRRNEELSAAGLQVPLR